MEFCLQPDQLAWEGTSRNKDTAMVLSKKFGAKSLYCLGRMLLGFVYIGRGHAELGLFPGLGMAWTGMLSLTANAVSALTGTYVTSSATNLAIKCSAFPAK